MGADDHGASGWGGSDAGPGHLVGEATVPSKYVAAEAQVWVPQKEQHKDGTVCVGAQKAQRKTYDRITHVRIKQMYLPTFIVHVEHVSEGRCRTEHGSAQRGVAHRVIEPWQQTA